MKTNELSWEQIKVSWATCDMGEEVMATSTCMLWKNQWLNSSSGLNVWTWPSTCCTQVPWV